MIPLPPLPVSDLAMFKHPLALPFRFFGWDFEVYESDTLLCLFDCLTGERKAIWDCHEIGRYLDALMLDDRVVFIGYNSRGYDNAIAALCVAGQDQKTIKLANDVLMGKAPVELASEWGCRGPFETEQDAAFQTPGYFDIYAKSYDAGFDLGQKMIGRKKIPCVSLKTWERLNGIPVLRTPVPFDKPFLTDEDRGYIEHYCHYDVAAVMRLVTGKEGQGNLLGRAGLIAEMPDKMKWGATRTKLAEIYLEVDKSLCPSKHDPLPNGGVAQIPSCIDLGKYGDIAEHFKHPYDYLVKNPFEREVCGVLHTFGVGGLHSSSPKPERYENCVIYAIDASSMYPEIHCCYNIFSRSVTKPEKFKRLKIKRVALKEKKDPMADSLKIVLNAPSGAARGEHTGFFDPMVGLTICVIGQLLLVDLLDKMEPHIDKVIQSNTDGIYFICRDRAKVEAAIAEFEKRTGMSMGWDEYDFMYQHNVNNYVVRSKKTGKLKLKGGLFRTAHATAYSPAQKVALARALGERIDMNQFTLADFAITCTRDKNTRGFLVNGVEIDDEYLEVVAVSPFEAARINSVRHDGTLVKARLCPECALSVKDADISVVDTDYYLNAAAAVEEKVEELC